uniref:Pectinesterase n=1 Tax=Solanum tuberosum TaxID=4113 RepID=M1E0M1_SOLTU
MALLQNCLIVARVPFFKQYNTITAQQREHEDSMTGIVLQNCSIKASQHLSNVTTYFGRPWGKFSRTVIMKSFINNLIDPRGWVEWIESSIVSRRPYYLEYKNRRSGDVTKGVTWASVTTDPNITINFMVGNFINGDQWIPTNIPRYVDLS